MSGLEALSLACNILQLINAAGQAISFCKKVYEGSTPDARLTTTASTLKALSDEIYKDSNVVQTVPSKRRLCELAKKCNETARALDEESKFLTSHQAKGSLRATLALAAKSNWRKKRLERLKKELQAHQGLLDSQLLANVCTQGEAIKAQQASDFAKLDLTMQRLVAGIATGQKKQSELIRILAQGISVHVSQEANRLTEALEVTVANAQGALESHITESIGTLKLTQEEGRRQAVSHEQQQRLLRSLKFPGMYARQNMLKEPAVDTYKWIFSGHDEKYDIKCDFGETLSDNLSETLRENVTALRANAEPYKPWDDFNEWLKSDSQLYWVSGKPGSGKSTLMKFIAQHPQTIESLSTWQQSCRVITYYFWKPGSSLQRSLRGLRFTLLHQLLSTNDTLLNQFFPKFRTCDEPEDWAVSGLDQALFAALAAQPTSVCIFLDGLDEICIEDGPAEVLRLISRLCGLSNVKVCASSRPEWPFEGRLGREQHLRLQDLTSRDMRVTAQRALSPYENHSTKQNPKDFDTLVHSVCSKAEGVFLWLELALRDLITGFINEDSYEDLGRRLSRLPSDLADLYWDMWARQNSSSSSELYQKTAAAMLRTVWVLIKAHEPHTAKSLTILELYMITQSEHLLHDGLILDLNREKLQEIDWEKFDRDIRIKSAGLLQTRNAADLRFPTRLPQIYLPRSKIPFYRTVNFIHRSAYDFLTETTNGRDIISYDTLDLVSVREPLITSKLALIHLHISELATATSEVEVFERQMYYYEISHDFADLVHYLSGDNGQQAIGLHLNFLQEHKPIGVEPEVFIAYLAMEDSETLLDSVLVGLRKFPKAQQESIANRTLYILCFAKPIIRPLFNKNIGAVLLKLRTLGANLDLLARPPVDQATFQTGAHGPGCVSARVLGLCYAFRSRALITTHSAQSVEYCDTFITHTLDACLDGIDDLELQARTYVSLSTFIYFGRTDFHLFRSSNFSPKMPFFLVEVDIAFIVQALISSTLSPASSRWNTMLSQRRPYFQVRYCITPTSGNSSIPKVFPHQLWGPIDDTTGYELSRALMAPCAEDGLNTRGIHEHRVIALRSAYTLLEQLQAAGAIELRAFRDISPRHLELLSRICEGLGLDENMYRDS